MLLRWRGTCEREQSLAHTPHHGTHTAAQTTEKCSVFSSSTVMRGGRGGGRGRGRSAPSAGQDLIRETQMDLGMDKFGPDQVSTALALLVRPNSYAQLKGSILNVRPGTRINQALYPCYKTYTYHVFFLCRLCLSLQVSPCSTKHI